MTSSSSVNCSAMPALLLCVQLLRERHQLGEEVSTFAAPQLYSSIIFWNSSRKLMRVRFSFTIRASFTAIFARSF